MSNNTVKVHKQSETTPFQFSDGFNDTFKSMIKEYADALSLLNKIIKSNPEAEYGVCNSMYKMRYLKPTDISTYVSNLEKAFNMELLGNNVNDINAFTIGSIKRALEDNGCVPIDDVNMMSRDRSYVNPKEFTMEDILEMYESDYSDVGIYSNIEMMKRNEIVAEDVKKLNEMHFTAAMKNVVNKLPSVLAQFKGHPVWRNEIAKKILTTYIEEYILFACALNTVCVYAIGKYVDPSVDFMTGDKPDDEKKNIIQEGFVMEYTDDSDKDENGKGKKKTITTPTAFDCYETRCRLLKTNNLTIQNKIPFNCNMRDVVLQDVTPNFADTHAALHFLIKDPRSPISCLLMKYSDNPKMVDPFMITNMFIGHDRECCGCCGGPLINNDNSLFSAHKEEYFKTAHSSVTWLDNIAHGNHYIDGNYRRDGNGNARVYPIENTLSMLYKLFDGCGKKTNTDLANNILAVAGVMREIILDYPDGCIKNWHLVKDILTTLGEILTKDVLHLYYNNTRVINYTDSMPDTMIPGYAYMESVVMEADAAGNNNQNANNGKQQSVQFKNQQGGNAVTGVNNIKFQASGLLRRFSQWVQKQLRNIGIKFNEKHQKELDWIKQHDDLNQSIATAIQQKTFQPYLNNFPNYHIPGKDVVDNVNIKDTVTKYLDIKKPFDPKVVLKEMLPNNIPDQIVDEILNGAKDNKSQDYLTQYLLYGKISNTPEQNFINGELTVEKWNEMINDLKNAQPLMEKMASKYSSDLKAAVDTLLAEERKAESEQSKEDNNTQSTGDGRAKRVKELLDIVQNKIANTFEVKALNNISQKFYGDTYTMYRDIISGYQQQSNNATQPAATNNTNTTGTNQQGAAATNSDVITQVQTGAATANA